MNIENDLNEALDIAHNELYERINSPFYQYDDNDNETEINFYKDVVSIDDIFDATVFNNKSFRSKLLTFGKYKIENFYDVSVTLTNRELSLNKEDFINEIIQPAIGALKRRVEEYYFKNNKPIIIPNFTYDSFIVKYDKNMGLGLCFKNDILSMRCVCGTLI